ncbi:MAG: hypothetical protein AB1592_13015 [Pseudomonadota bacterium]
MDAAIEAAGVGVGIIRVSLDRVRDRSIRPISRHRKTGGAARVTGPNLDL